MAVIRYFAELRTEGEGYTPRWQFIVSSTEAGAPTTDLAEGDFCYSLDTNSTRYWDGAAWQTLSGGAGGSGAAFSELMLMGG
jgi:hypothetical protein